MQAEGEERPMRVLEFDFESQRVVQAQDLFVPTPVSDAQAPQRVPIDGKMCTIEYSSCAHD